MKKFTRLICLLVLMLLCGSIQMIKAVSSTYCSTPSGHLGDANFGDAHARILLTITNVDANNISVKVEANTEAGGSPIDFLQVEPSGAGAVSVGTDEGALLSEYKVNINYASAPENVTFTIFWSNPGWGGRWMISGLVVPFAATCGPADTEIPTGFSATKGTVTSSSVELLLNATDNSGSVKYYITGGSTQTATATSGIEKSVVITGLTPETDYTFNIEAKDAAGNAAANNPLTVTAKTTAAATVTAAPIPGALDAPKVISIFSDAFSNITGTEFNPGWGQATVQSVVSISGNNTLKYTNLNYQGTVFGSHVYPVSMKYLHLDVWTSDETSIKVYPICWNGSGNEPEKYKEITSINLEQWNSYDIPLTDFTSQGLTMSDVYQIKIVGSGDTPGVPKKTIYLDNIYFWDDSPADTEAPTSFTAEAGTVSYNSIDLVLNATDNSGAVSYAVTYNSTTVNATGVSGTPKTISIGSLTANTDYTFSIVAKDATGNEATNSPLSLNVKTNVEIDAAPTPTFDAAKVISVFSGAYTDHVGTNFNPGWGQSTVQSIVNIKGNPTLQYANFNYQGTDLGGSHIDASSMTMLHVDIYTANENTIKITPISPGPKESLVTLSPVNHGVWNSYDIPLISFTGVDFTDIFQFKFDGGSGKTILIDNLYFYDNYVIDLANAKTAANALTPGDYIDFSGVTNALALPEGDRAEMVIKANTINSAIKALVNLVDKNLADAKAAEALLVAADYNDYSAVTTAKAMPESSKEEKIAKTNALNTAMAALVNAVDDQLAQAKAAANALTPADYTDFGPVTNALSNPETTKGEKIVKTQNINNAIAGLVSIVDDNLAKAKTAEAALTADDYMDYSAVTTALALPESTKDEKIAKTAAINTAIAALITVDSKLTEAKNAAAALNSADFVDFSGVTSALALPETNKTEKLAKVDAINNAIAALVTSVDDNLAKAKTAANSLTASDYASFDAVTSALAMAESATDEKIAKTNAINTAIANLVTNVDANLASAKTAAGALTATDYVSFQAVTDALSLPETNNTEKSAKTAAINSAIAALVTVVDNDLSNVKIVAAALTASDYVSFAAVTNALAMVESTKDEKIAKTTAINTAIANLISVVDNNLAAAKTAAGALIASDYVSFQAVTDALALNENNNIEKVAKTTAINNAITALVSKVDDNLAKAKTAEALLTASDYVDYSQVTAALALPESSKSEKIAKTTAINAAISKLVRVVDANLAAAKDAEAALTSSDYYSYSAVTSALALPETNDTEKIAKTSAINTAISNLVTVDAALTSAKNSEAALNADDYYSYEAVNAALALPEGTHSEKKAKTTAINNAITGLQTIDAALTAAKAAESALNSADYYSYTNVDAALALPETTNDEKKAKITAINSSIAALLTIDAALAKAKTDEAALNSADYNSYAAVTNALSLPEGTNSEKNAKTTAINNAIASLEMLDSVVDNNLAAAKTSASQLTASDYVSFTAVTNALALSESSKSEKISKTSAINSAINGLKLVADVNLAAAKAAAADLIAGEYVNFASVTSALTMAETTKNDKISKTNAINAAIAALVTVVDDNLAKAKASEATLSAADYVSYAGVTAALALPESNKAEKIAKTNAINSAIINLVSAVDANLAAAKTVEAALSASDYVSYAAVSDAMALPESSNSEKVAKTNAINAAIAGLVTKVDDNLAKAKTAANTLTASEYVDFSAVTTALGLNETSNDEKIAKTFAINSAITSLVSVVDANLAKAKNSAAGLTASDYANFTTITAALSLSESSKSEKIAKTTAINNAIAALVTVVDDNLAKAKAAEALLNSSEYVDYSAVNAALALAETTKEEKTAKTSAINAAIFGLITKVDDNLIKAKTAAGSLSTSDYVDFSAVTSALALPESSKEEKVSKTTAINSSISSLVTVIDNNLAKAKTAAGLLNASDYVDFSAVTSALALPESSKEEKVAKTTAINSSISALVTITDSNLAKAKTAAGLLNTSDYVDFSAVTIALALSESSKDEKVAKTTAINDAISGLITLVDDKLAKAKAVAALVNAANVVNYTLLSDALALPESTKEEKIAKTEAIKTAIAGLISKVDDNLAKEKAAEALLNADDYVLYKDVLDALALPESSDAEKIAKTDAIFEAIAALVTKVDDNLAKAKAAEALLNEQEYVSYAAVTSALGLPESNEAEKIAKTKAINDAIAGLVKKGSSVATTTMSIEVYPNPTVGSLYIKGLAGSMISILDIQGRQVLKLQSANETEVVDLSNMSKGIYQVRVSNNGNITGAKIILK